VGYIRVSTEEQARTGISLDAQEAKTRAYAEAKDLRLVEVVRDEGSSGKDLKRPGLQRLIEICTAGKVDAVVVVKLDRLSRRTRDLLRLVEDVFIKKGVELHSVNESLDTSTPHGRFVLTLFGALAQMEREVISDRTKDALAHKRANRQPTGHPPYGYSANGKRNRLVPVPEELAVVSEILRRWRSGMTYRAIAAKLNANGVCAKQGGRWHHTSVSKVVQRRDWYEER